MAEPNNIGEMFVRLSADISGLRKGMNDAHASVSDGVRLMSKALASLGIAFSAGAALRKFVTESTEAQAAQAQLAARLRSTEGAAGRTLDQLTDLSSALQNTTTFSDEAVQEVEALLLTFKKVKGDNFDQATAAALDMATALGTSATGAALQLGKALEDPVRGLSALRRSGVSFTAAQQDMIKAMVQAGDVTGAQAKILKELETQFGGAAAAARDTLGGALANLSNQWGELFEVSRDSSAGVVGFINDIADALPILNYELGRLVGWLQKMQRFRDSLKIFGEAGEAFAGAGAAGAGAAGSWGEAAADFGEGLEDAAEDADQLKDAIDGLRASLETLSDPMDAIAALEKFRGSEVARAIDEVTTAFEAQNKGLFGKGQGFTPGAGGTGEAPRPGAGTEIQLKEAGPLAEAFGALKDFGKALGGILSALNPWKLLLDAVGRALGDFLLNVTPIVELLAAALMPILKALFPVFKLLAIAATYVGQVFFTIAGGILKAVGYLVKGLGALIEKLPGVGDFGLKKAGQAMIDLGAGFFEASGELGDARDEIKKLEWKDALDPLTDAANETAEALRNVPSLFNANLARFRATQGGGLTAPSSLPGTIEPVPQIAINGPVTVVSNDPETFIDKLRQKARRGGASGLAPAY